jgi:hypothetical protein
MQKRGISQIDWVISLAFFSIFLMLFFMFINSRVSMPLKSDTLVNDAETAFLNDVSWQVQKTPIFTDFYQTGPVIAQFYPDNMTNYYLGGKCFAMDDNRLFYVASGDSVNYLIASNETYPKCNETLALTSDENEATTKQAGFEFENGLLEKAYYKGKLRISDLQFFGRFSNYSYESTDVFAKYTASAADMEQKTYVIANSTGVMVFIE